MAKDEQYIPALRFGWLTPLYDPVLRWVIREDQFKQQLVRQAQIQAGQKVLDLGCGTATLTILIKQTQPEADVTGLDGAKPKCLYPNPQDGAKPDWTYRDIIIFLVEQHERRIFCAAQMSLTWSLILCRWLDN